ncbi:hypothetical protein [Kitasatospora sp. NPDC085879]|jgi:hypothetical protein|uniref:hypothetical protein n=1 Tax=Kitasatospora sp. NPDC085879 TaxID=3154769 RepID=UPI0034255C71
MPTEPHHRASRQPALAAATALLGALAAAGCSSAGSTSTSGQPFSDWYSQGGETYIAAIRADTQAMPTSAVTT